MTKRRRKSIVLLLLVLIGLSGCFEFRLPEIGPIVPPAVEVGPYEFYVASMTVDFDTLLAFADFGENFNLNELRETYPYDPSGETDWFVMRETFSENFPLEDMELDVDPVSSSISQSMEFVEFSTRTFTLSEPIELQDIIDLSLVPDGTPVPINSVAIPPDTSYADFPMDRQRFSAGTLSVTLQNDFQCYLGVPISITVYDSLTGGAIDDGTGDTLRLLWDTHIPPGGNSTESISLAGVEFPSTIMIVTEAVLCGNGHDTVLTVSDEMKTSSFSADGEISGLVGDFVEGNLDPQTLNNSSTMDFGADLNDAHLTVDKVYLDTSHISIEISNTSNITGKLLLELYSLDTSELAGIQYFSTDSMTIPSGSSQTYNFNLYNASFDLSEDFEYNTYIHIPGQYGQLDASDEYEVSFEFYGENPGDPIKIESVDASFTNMEYSFNNASIDLDLNSIIPEQFNDIALDTIDLALDILSGITIPMTLNLNLVGVKNSGADSLSISLSQLVTGPGSDNHLIFQDAVDIINFRPDSLFFNGDISLNGSGNFPLQQNIQVDGSFAVPLQFEISAPLSFSTGYTSQNFGELPAFLNDFAGTIEAEINNTFQFGVNFTMLAAGDTNYFDNATYIDCVKTLIDLNIPAKDTTTQSIELTKEDYDFLANMPDSTWLSMVIELTGRTDGQPTTFLSSDYVTLDLFVQAEGTLDIAELFPDSTETDTTGTDTTGGAQ